MTHRHFRINGRIVNIPSCYIAEGWRRDQISDRLKETDAFKQLIEVAKNRRHPEWLEFSETDASSKVLALPGREQIDTPVDEQLIVVNTTRAFQSHSRRR